MRKTRLNTDALRVETFRTSREDQAPPRGTVHGQAACTYWDSCLCKTAYYYCGDGYETLYSCTYTHDAPCFGSGSDCV